MPNVAVGVGAPTWQGWVTADQILPDPRVTNVPLPDGITPDMVCSYASTILYRASGARFGTRVDTIRPYQLSAGCACGLGSSASWSGGYGVGVGAWSDRFFPEGWGCGCSAVDGFVLPGNGPVDPSTVTVQVDGVTLIPQGQAGAQWQLYSGRRLVRILDVNTGAMLSWPCCQLLARPLGQPGTWAVTYRHGTPVPADGQMACLELAVEIWRAWANQPNKLPQRTTRVHRAGLDIDLASDMKFVDSGKTGMWLVDLWIHAVNPNGLRRQARVTSVDRPRSARI